MTRSVTAVTGMGWAAVGRVHRDCVDKCPVLAWRGHSPARDHHGVYVGIVGSTTEQRNTHKASEQENSTSHNLAAHLARCDALCVTRPVTDHRWVARESHPPLWTQTFSSDIVLSPLLILSWAESPRLSEKQVGEYGNH